MATRATIGAIGGPEALHLETGPTLAPEAGEVRVRLFSIGVNRADAAFRAGKYLVQPSPPCGLGVEGAGVVTALGPGVDAFREGDRVSIVPAFMQGGRYATYVSEGVFPADSLIAIPDSLDDVAASAIWVSYLTAWGALVELGGLRAGDTVLISAASSSVGLSAIQIANAVGAVPIATTRTRAKAEAIRQAGAAHVIASDEEDVPRALGAITGNAGLRLAFDCIAGPFAERIVPCMAEEGELIIYGGLSDQPMQLDRRTMLRRGITVRGYTLMQILNRADRKARGRAFVLDGIAAGTLTPVIDSTFPFADVTAVHSYLESNVQFGKIVMTLPGETST